ncbi:hypothetical protein V496_10486 [Pseudogymnoascus sp. VKM F-4515 (FW-2607)]|nr:hypothetical protein V496_10486 [Pseudogymnoascus sp. VKM F-4515 (FW-2607)]
MPTWLSLSPHRCLLTPLQNVAQYLGIAPRYAPIQNGADPDQISSDNGQKDVVPAATASIEIAAIETTKKEDATIAPSTAEISVSGVVSRVARGTTVSFLCGGGKGS